MTLTPRFEEALVFAATSHGRQLRKGTDVPYISHPMAVCSLVLEHGGSEDEALAALLHDAVEDCGVTVGEIGARFGARVADIVAGCSDSFEPDPREKAPWRERKERYLAHIAKASDSELLVSAADKLHNARCILADYRELGAGLWTRFRTGSAEDVLWYYETLARIFSARGTHRKLVGELCRVVATLARMVRGNAGEGQGARSGEPASAGASLELDHFDGGKEGTSSHLSVQVGPDGDLVLEGQDIGSLPQQCFGDSDYEYWVTVRSAERDRLQLHLVAALLAGTDCKSSRFMGWLKSKGIPYEFSSY